MKFVDIAERGNNQPTSYVMGMLLIFILYFLGSLGIIADLELNFPGLSIQSMDALFYQTMGHTRFFFWVLFPYLLVFIGLLLHIHFVHKRRMLSALTSRDHFRWKRFFFAFALIVTIMGGLLAIQIYADSFGHGQAFVFQFDAAKFYPLLAVSLLMLPIQTACEELLFRSYLLQGLKLRLKRTGTSILLSSLMFGLMHIGNPEIQEMGYHMLVYYFLSGLFLALITTVDDGLELAIGYHFANNLIAAIFVTTDWQVFRTDALFLNHSDPGNGWSSIGFLLVLLPTVFLIFKRMFKWPSWKEIWQSM
ncbi:MAG: lysostaphin resistance A-like protein [Flavobacteriales bacterium]